MRHRELRRFVDSVMACEGRLREVMGVGSDDNGFPITIYETRYEGRCLIYPADRDARVVEVVGSSVPIARYTVVFPAGTSVEIGYVFDVTSSPDAPEVVGPVFRISDAPVDAWSVARQCIAEHAGT
ncbi:hypothetical protein FNH13_08315 [Ornithinimicrobium ciconiae]|uniref:Uncharacterized protein n=1 Tax=Ornithinimicrobium ciconiae TaxID=2594265 RepID=A0A516GA27_9MICO|nr:DUF6093 family protein [Ornithinimicrobium ciconiae]QDO88345.1 hypothetical protein FNH13_08315 [Ornithinimicrobium ciconiae]